MNGIWTLWIYGLCGVYENQELDVKVKELVCGKVKMISM